MNYDTIHGMRQFINDVKQSLESGFRNLFPQEQTTGNGAGVYTFDLSDSAYGAEAGNVDLQELTDAVEEAGRLGGNPGTFYELASRAVISGSVTRAVVHSRRSAVQHIQPQVMPASDSARDMMIADEVNLDLIPFVIDIVPTLLEAVVHGVSVVELQWSQVNGGYNVPTNYRYIEPVSLRKWKRNGNLYVVTTPERNSGREIVVGDGRYVQHNSGPRATTPFISGVAIPILYWWVVKNRARIRWSAFTDKYGIPFVMGRYSADATEEDMRALRAAVSNVGRDVAALIPEEMSIDAFNPTAAQGGSTNNAASFDTLMKRVNREIEIAVVGQVSSTEGIPGSLGQQLAQDSVRRDISLEDAAGLSRTVTRQLVTPYVRRRFGDRDSIPRIVWPVPEQPEELGVWSQAVATMIEQGLQVRSAEVYERLGLTPPSGGEDVLGGAGLTN